MPTFICVGLQKSRELYLAEVRDRRLDEAHAEYIKVDYIPGPMTWADGILYVGGKDPAGIYAYSVSSEGTVQLVASKPHHKYDTGGRSPTFLLVVGDALVSAYYHEGMVLSHQLTVDGSNQPAGMLEGIDGCHSIQAFPYDSSLLVCTACKSDRLVSLSLDRKTAKLSTLSHINTKAGPRHLVFGADGEFAFVMHEHDSGVRMHPARPILADACAEVLTLPQETDCKPWGAEIKIHKNQWLFTSDRSSNLITILRLRSREDQAHPLLEVLQSFAVPKQPRSFTITTDDILAVVGQADDYLELYDVSNVDDTEPPRRLQRCIFRSPETGPMWVQAIRC